MRVLQKAGITICAVTLMVFTSAACQQENFERAHYESFSIRALPDWQQRHERGSTVFTGPAATGLDRTTIVVRPVRYKGRAGARTHADVVAATKEVLASLPRATVRALPTDRGDGFQIRYLVTKKRALYDRQHVVLGAGENAFHIMITAPARTLSKRALKTFASVLDTLREEV